MRTTIRSRISPGIFDESKIFVIPLPLRICETSGFQVTTTSWLVSLKNAPAMSESEVFTYFTRFISPDEIIDGHAALEQILRNGFFHQQHALAGNLAEREIVTHQHGVVAIGIIADDDGCGVDAGGRRHVERLHVSHGAGIDVLGDESV